MDLSVGKAFVVGVLMNLLCHCKGEDICSTNTQMSTGSLMTGNYPAMTSQLRCKCRLTNPVSHPKAHIHSTLNFETEDYEDPCRQRVIINNAYLDFNVCPRDYVDKQHMVNIELDAGEHMFIYTLGTPGKNWMVKFEFTSDSVLDVSCQELANDTDPTCTCADNTWGGGPGGPAAASDDIGKRVGIGFGAVLGFLAILAIVALILFILRKRKREREESEPTTTEAPPLQRKEPPVIHDPRYGQAYPEYADVGDPRINTNLAYTPDNPDPFKKSSDSGLQSMHHSQDRIDQPPSYNHHYIPPQPNAAAPDDPSVLYARPNAKRPAPESSRRSLTGMGAITGSSDGLYPYADNEMYMTDSQTNSQNTSKDYTQTEV